MIEIWEIATFVERRLHLTTTEPTIWVLQYRNLTWKMGKSDAIRHTYTHIFIYSDAIEYVVYMPIVYIYSVRLFFVQQNHSNLMWCYCCWYCWRFCLCSLLLNAKRCSLYARFVWATIFCIHLKCVADFQSHPNIEFRMTTRLFSSLSHNNGTHRYRTLTYLYIHKLFCCSQEILSYSPQII